MYHTHAKLAILGRAMVVLLDDCEPTLETQVKQPHMTVLFRKAGYTEDELKTFQAYRNAHYPEQLTFTLGPYVKGFDNSDGIYGELRSMCVLLRAVFVTWCEDMRPPHVMLRSRRRPDRKSSHAHPH